MVRFCTVTLTWPSLVTAQEAIAPTARFSIAPLHPTFLFGQNVAIVTKLENTGSASVAVKSRVGRAYFAVEVFDESGAKIAKAWPDRAWIHLNLEPNEAVAPGATRTETLSLENEVLLYKPGKYRVTVSYDLGSSLEKKQPLPSASAEFGLVMPTEAEADAISAAIQPFELRDYPQRFAFSPYLKYSLKSARSNPNRVASIAMMESPEATAALIELLCGRPPIATAAALALADRLPRVPGMPGVQTGFMVPDAQLPRRLNALAWRAEFNEPVRAYARQIIELRNAPGNGIAALMLSSVGRPADLSLVLQALEQCLQAALKMAPARRLEWNSADHLALVQREEECYQWMSCAQILVRRGAMLPPVDKPSAFPTANLAARLSPRLSSGHFIEVDTPIKVLEIALQHKMPFMRRMALESLLRTDWTPGPITLEPSVQALLPRLINDDEGQVRALACRVAQGANARDLLPIILKQVGHTLDAQEAAIALGGRYEALVIRANQLSRPGWAQVSFDGLFLVLTDRGRFQWKGKPTDDEARALQPKWLRFLQENEARLRQGKLFTSNDADWPSDLLPVAWK